jgi:hypothetical protein
LVVWFGRTQRSGVLPGKGEGGTTSFKRFTFTATSPTSKSNQQHNCGIVKSVNGALLGSP